MAAALQRRLQPGAIPRLSAVETAHVYLPESAGGGSKGQGEGLARWVLGFPCRGFAWSVQGPRVRLPVSTARIPIHNHLRF